MSRNFFTPGRDRRFIPRVRGPRQGHLWINLLGRDLIVKRCRPTWLGVVGTFTAGLGVIGLTWGSLKNFDPQRLGIACLIVGITLICFKKLETKNLAADEIYNVGYERGEADSYDRAYQEGFADGERSRPVVVPFPPYCTCGNPACAQPVGSVADRG